MEKLVLFLKGLMIGIGKIIPGLSGSMIMMIFGLYEKTIDKILNFFDDVINNVKYLIVLSSGVLLSIIFVSKVIKVIINKYYFLIICFFVGLILGGIPSLLKELKGTTTKTNVGIFVFFFIIIISLSFVNITDQNITNVSNNFFLLFIVGVIEAATMIVPGISGTAVLMSLGLYHILLDVFSNLINISLFISNIKSIIPFLLGLGTGGLIFIKVMQILLLKHKVKSYWVITSLALSSVLLMIVKTLKFNYYITEIIFGISLLVVGYILSRMFELKFNK